jgi:hypothetical protein
MSPWLPAACTVFVGIAVLISQRHSAYLARRLQLRIEKHRLDPNFPLDEPPSKLRSFLRTYGTDISCVIVNGGLLGFWLSRPGPVGRLRLFNVAFICGSTAWILGSNALGREKGKLVELLTSMSETDRLIGERVTALIGIVKDMTDGKDKGQQ